MVGLAVPVLAVVVVLVAERTSPETSGGTALADGLGVTIEWVEGAIDCGGVPAVGCWDPAAPKEIEVVSALDEETERTVILHELAHVLQAMVGVPGDECGADEIARALGATRTGGYSCGPAR